MIIANGQTVIEASMFSGCSNLKSVVIPDSITKIANYAFWGTALKSIILPDNLTYLGENSFSYYQFDSDAFTVRDGLKYIGST